MPLALIMPVSFATVSATGSGLSLVTMPASSWVMVHLLSQVGAAQPTTMMARGQAAGQLSSDHAVVM
jgi:hypothetical protein